MPREPGANFLEGVKIDLRSTENITVEIARRIDFTTVSEDDFIRELLHLTANTRADCSCKVAMGLTHMFCEEKKKLISPESVRTIRRATRALRKFRKVKTKAFAPQSGWLRPEPPL